MMPDGSVGQLAAALAKAQAEFPAILRDKEVDSRSYRFKYAPLDSIIAAVRPALGKNGLAFSQLLDGDDLLTILMHESGETLQGRVTLPREGTVQQFGSAITYLRRYALQAILGVAAEEDDDGESAAKASPRREVPQRSVAPSMPSEEDVAALRARFAPDTSTEEAPAPPGVMTTAELFAAAEAADVPKAMLTLNAKSLFGANRWKIIDLTDEERAQLWAEVAPVPA